MQSNKVLVVGLDGGTYAVLRPLLDAGKLPTMAAMMEQGSWGELASTIPPHTAPAWASFSTGKNPGKHGIFQFRSVNRSLYEGKGTRIVNSGTLSGQTLWDIIGKEGKKVGVMNVPLTYPPYEVNGFMITGMLTPRESGNFTFPPHLGSSIGDYEIDVSVGEGEYSVLDDLNTEDQETLLGLIEQLKTLVDVRTQTASRLIETHSPDFFIILFTETDRLQHILWPYLQPNQEQPEGPIALKIRGAVEDFYRHLDDNLAKLLQTVGEDTIKILMSDHGFGPSTKKNVNFNLWLRDNGLLRLYRNPKSTLNPRVWLRRMGLNRERLYSLISLLFPGNVVRRLERTWAKVVKTPIDWSSTKAVFIPVFEFVGGIEIVHREDANQPRDLSFGDYEEFRSSLIEQLLELKDPQTNQAIVLEAYRREELYRGVHICDAPDIVFVMNTDYRGEKGMMSKGLVSQKPQNVGLWTGTHRREGVVILSGPNISPGRIASKPRIEDLTPTILYLLGIAIPEDMDGRVIQEVIEESYLAQHQIEHTMPTSSPREGSETKQAGFSEEELEKVRKQLENLGYLS